MGKVPQPLGSFPEAKLQYLLKNGGASASESTCGSRPHVCVMAIPAPTYLRGTAAARTSTTSSLSQEDVVGGVPAHCSTSHPPSSTSATVAMRGGDSVLNLTRSPISKSRLLIPTPCVFTRDRE